MCLHRVAPPPSPLSRPNCVAKTRPNPSPRNPKIENLPKDVLQIRTTTDYANLQLATDYAEFIPRNPNIENLPKGVLQIRTNTDYAKSPLATDHGECIVYEMAHLCRTNRT